MKNTLLPVALLFALASCGDRQQPSTTIGTAKKDTVVTADTSRNPRANTGKTEVIDTATVFKQEYNSQHYFSNLNEKDSFTLKLSGSELLTSKGVLEITNAQKELIYQYQFTTVDLLMDPKSVPVGEQTKRINEILKHYFDEDNFKTPAINSKQTFEEAFANPDEANRADWNNIKANSKAISFRHREGYEGSAKIAYSAKRKKAMLISYMD